MRLTILAAAAVLLGAGAAAAYDESWYVTEFWSGEYPTALAVAAPGVTVPARAEMDRDQPASIACALPYKALFNPWNEERSRLSEARYFTASKIVPLVAREAFAFEHDQEGGPLQIAPGQRIEYLIYGAEGSFLVRIDGREYAAYQDLCDHMEPVGDDDFVQEEWLNLRCEDGTPAWILLDDLMLVGEDGMVRYSDGLWNVTGGTLGFEEYGRTRDLTDEEIAAGDPNSVN
jgi:hypothetical protein